MPIAITHPDGKFTYSNKEGRAGSSRPTARGFYPGLDDDLIDRLNARTPVYDPPEPCITSPDIPPDSPLRLGLSKETNLPATPRKKSLTMQSKAKNRVRQALYVMERVVNKENMTFFTGTVPPEIGRVATSANWSDAMDVFLKRVRRRLEGQDMKLIDLYVLEVHPERSKAEGMPVLHAHLVLAGRKPRNTWAITPSEYTAMWQAAWEAVLPDIAKTLNWSASTNVQRVKKSVSRYFSKYLSKGTDSELLDLLASAPDSAVPRKWARMSRNLVNLLVKNTYRYTGEAARSLIDFLMSGFHDITFAWYPVLITREDGTCFDIAGVIYGLEPPGIKFRDW